jgi:predicted nuclease with TOPRIM domain
MSEEHTEKPKFSEEDFKKLNETIELKDTEIKTLKEANEKLSSDNTSALERISKIEAEARNTKVGSILEGCYFKDDESRNKLHEIYVKSALSYEEIEQATEGLRHIKSGKTVPDSRLVIKAASTSDSKPYWLTNYEAVTGGSQ